MLDLHIYYLIDGFFFLRSEIVLARKDQSREYHIIYTAINGLQVKYLQF